MWIPSKSLLVVLVVISSKFVSVCNRFHAELVILTKIMHFEGGTQI